MVLSFWNDRYRENETSYGDRPNLFLEQELKKLTPGKILLPAEGEGRNALHAVRRGWTVDAFDFSEIGRDKALEKASKEGLSLSYSIEDLSTIQLEEERYDGVALIYAHMPSTYRREFHAQVIRTLKPGGTVILEAFSKSQLGLPSGGPKDPDWLYALSDLKKDFSRLSRLNGEEVEIILDEGPFHQGKARVIRLVGKK